MSEPIDREAAWKQFADASSARPTVKDKLKLTFRLAFLIVVVALIGANFSCCMPPDPGSEFPDVSGWRTGTDNGFDGVATPWILSPEKAREIAVEEVKKREGWSGTAEKELSQEGYTYYVTVRRKPEERAVRRNIEIDGPTRKVTMYDTPE